MVEVGEWDQERRPSWVWHAKRSGCFLLVIHINSSLFIEGYSETIALSSSSPSTIHYVNLDLAFCQGYCIENFIFIP